MNWEFCYFVTTEIYQFLMALLAAGAYFYLVRDFVKSRKTAFLTGIVYLITMLILWYDPHYLPSFWAYMIGVMAGLLVMSDGTGELSSEDFSGVDILCRPLAGGPDNCYSRGAAMEGGVVLCTGIYRCGERVLFACGRVGYRDSGTDCIVCDSGGADREGIPG